MHVFKDQRMITMRHDIPLNLSTTKTHLNLSMIFLSQHHMIKIIYPIYTLQISPEFVAAQASVKQMQILIHPLRQLLAMRLKIYLVEQRIELIVLMIMVMESLMLMHSVDIFMMVQLITIPLIKMFNPITQ